MSLRLQLRDYRLTTAQILYHLPDHPSVLQEFTWQCYDIAPRFPEVHRFLEFWKREIDGPLHSVHISSCVPIEPGTWRSVTAEYTLH